MTGSTKLEPRAADKLSVLLALGFFVTSLLQGAVPVLAPALRAEAGLSSARVGLLMSVFLAGYAAVQLPVGAFAARRPGHALAVGFVAMLVGSLAFAGSSSYGAYVAARAVQGVGAGAMLPAAGAVLARWVPIDRLGRAWSVYGGSSGVGYLVLFLVLARVVESGGSRAFFLVVAVLVALAGILTMSSPYVRSSPTSDLSRVTVRGFVSDLRALLRSAKVTLLGFANVAGITVSVGTLTWTPSYIHDRLGAGLGAAAALTAGFAVAQLVGAPVVTYLLTKVGYLPLLAAVFAGMVAALSVLAFQPGQAPTFFLAFVIGLLTMLAFSPSYAMIPMVVEARLVGLAGGYLNGFGFVGALGGPWLFGAFIDRGWGYGVGFTMLAAFALGGVAAVAGLWRSFGLGNAPTGVVH